MNYKKIDHDSRLASRRFGKETHLTILVGKQLIDFINRNSLLPSGFFITNPEYGYSSIRNRVVAIPTYNLEELKDELDRAGFITPFNPDVHVAGSAAASNRIIEQIVASESLAEFLKQTMVVVYLINFDPSMAINKLKLSDVSIDTIDVSGTINGTLVPKIGTDINEGKSL